MRALSLDKRHQVQLDCDTDTPKTTFTIRPLSTRELAKCKDVATSFKAPATQDAAQAQRAAGAVDAQFNPNTAAYEIARLGVVGWSGMKGEGDLEFAFTGPQSVDSLPLEAVRELSIKIEGLSNLSEAEAKL